MHLSQDRDDDKTETGGLTLSLAYHSQRRRWERRRQAGRQGRCTCQAWTLASYIPVVSTHLSFLTRVTRKTLTPTRKNPYPEAGCGFWSGQGVGRAEVPQGHNPCMWHRSRDICKSCTSFLSIGCQCKRQQSLYTIVSPLKVSSREGP